MSELRHRWPLPRRASGRGLGASLRLWTDRERRRRTGGRAGSPENGGA